MNSGNEEIKKMGLPWSSNMIYVAWLINGELCSYDTLLNDKIDTQYIHREFVNHMKELIVPWVKTGVVIDRIDINHGSDTIILLQDKDILNPQFHNIHSAVELIKNRGTVHLFEEVMFVSEWK
jgi:hypothetical protein